MSTEEDLGLPLSQAVTAQILKAGKCFKDWEKEAITELLKISRCKNLLTFLKDNIKSVAQLKNFVELASISAGMFNTTLHYNLFSIFISFSKFYWKVAFDDWFRSHRTA